MLLALGAIAPDPEQPRKRFTEAELATLTDSMRAQGQLSPIIVRPAACDGSFLIIAGERRYRAALRLEWLTIEADIRTDVQDAADVLAMQLSENLARADMTPMEEAHAYARLRAAGWTTEKITTQLGLPQWQAQWRLDLLDLIPAVQTLVELGTLKPRVARYLARLSPAMQTTGLRRISSGAVACSDSAVSAMVDTLFSVEHAPEMFTEADVPRRTAATQRAEADYDAAIERAADALRLIADFEDDDLIGALGHRLPGCIDKLAALRAEADRMQRRLVRIDAAAQTRRATRPRRKRTPARA